LWKIFVNFIERIPTEWFFILQIFSKFFLRKFFPGRKIFPENILAGYLTMGAYRTPDPAHPVFPGSTSRLRKIPFRRVKGGKGSEIVNRAPFAKRSHYRAI
jgi:hypothetical protein